MARTLVLWVERCFASAFGAANPWHHLGALGFFLFWIIAATGIYIYAFFDTSVTGAYRSVEWMSRSQWYLGGVIRSLHRYAADAFIVILLAHLGKELALGRYRGFRWFSWVSGVPLIWLAYASGIGGYWLAYTFPPRALALGTLGALLLAALAWPVQSHPPADLTQVPLVLAIDWLYLFAHPLQYATSPGALWMLATGGTLALVALPLLARSARPLAAIVSPANCNGCGRCLADCRCSANVGSCLRSNWPDCPPTCARRGTVRAHGHRCASASRSMGAYGWMKPRRRAVSQRTGP